MNPEKKSQKTLIEYLSSTSKRSTLSDFQDLPIEEVKQVKRIKKSQFLYREDLEKPKNLKIIFNTMRNYLAGNLTGTTRDERLAEQLIFILFCKIVDELETENEPLIFQVNYPDKTDISQRVESLFNRLKNRFHSVFSDTDKIIIDSRNLEFIVKELERYSISEASRDSIGDAFEIFLGPSLRGNKGQFFTPKNVVKTIIQMVDPKLEEKLIDPACGSGGFLIEAISHLIGKSEISNVQDFEKKISNLLFGIEKDSFLAKIAGIYLMILGVSGKAVFCDNSLENPSNWETSLEKAIVLGEFDVVITNPPFGSKIPIKDKHILESFELGYIWSRLNNNSWKKGKKLHDKQPPQILFIERCLELLKPGGRMGIVLPDGLFGNPSDRYILEYINGNSKILGIISCSPLTFLPHTHTKTSILFVEKTKPEDEYEFFMAIAENVGHDKNGKPLYKMDLSGNILKDELGRKILNDDFPLIINRYRRFLGGEKLDHSHLGFRFNFSGIQKHVLIPEYYNPEIKEELLKLQSSGQFKLIKLSTLVEDEVVGISRGHEIGSKFYGTGNVPFVRTSDLINWEIDIDPKKQVSEEAYLQYKDRQDVRKGDILLISDGTFLIGKTAMVTEKDEKIVIQSHFKKIRVLKRETIDEYILLWSLNTDIVQKQIAAKTFVQSTISTLGNRLLELFLPIPSNEDNRKSISNEIRAIIRDKMMLKERMRNAQLITNENNNLKNFE